MIKDPAIKLKLANSYAGIANYWKFFDGETKQLKKFHTYEQKQDYEKNFQKWANGKPEFENILSDYEANYAAWTPYSKMRQYTNEGIMGSPLAVYAASLISLERELLKPGSKAEDIKTGRNC